MIRGTTQIAPKPMPLCGFRQTLCTNAAAHWERLLSGEHLSFPDSEGTPRYLHSTAAGSLAREFGRIRLRQRLSLKLFVLLHSGGGLSSVQIRGICIPSGIKNRGNFRSCRRRASIRLYYMVGQCARRKLYQRWILCDVRTKKSVDARDKLLYTVDKENADSSGFPRLSMQTDLLRKIPIDSAHPRNHRGGNYAGLRKKLCI